MTRFHVSGFIQIPVTKVFEARNIGEAVSRAEQEFDELANTSVKVLKEKAPNLASCLKSEGPVGLVLGVTSDGVG